MINKGFRQRKLQRTHQDVIFRTKKIMNLEYRIKLIEKQIAKEKLKLEVLKDSLYNKQSKLAECEYNEMKGE